MLYLWSRVSVFLTQSQFRSIINQMFGDSQNPMAKNQAGSADQVEVIIRNLPNQAKNQDILEYLSIAGSIKSHKFLKEQQRYSAIVVYHDIQSAELCKKHLDDRYYKGRALTIQIKKPYGMNTFNTTPLSYEEELALQIMKLKNEEKKVMLGLMKDMRKDGQIFQNFLASKPKIVQALLNKYSHE